MRVLAGIICLFIGPINLFPQKCVDFLIYDGLEKVLKYSIDTTSNWYILTQPYSGELRYIISGEETATFKEVTPIVFSPDGTRWAFAGRDNTSWHIVTSDTSFPVFAEKIIELGFSNNSEIFYYLIRNGMETKINFNGQNIDILNFYGKVFISYNGRKVAFVLQKGRSQSLVIPNEFISEDFDQVAPLGFWNDENFIYAGRRGHFWQIYKNSEPLAEQFVELIDMKINREGSSAVFLIRRNAYDELAVLYSDKYSEPIFTKSYHSVSNLCLHPSEPLFAFTATKDIDRFIVYGGAEYPLGQFEAMPFFTHDGSELFYCFCHIECYFYVNGKRFTLPGGVKCLSQIARKPNTSTIAYTNSTHLVMLNYFSKVQFSGIMVDETSPVIFNYRTQRYEALGRIGNKIYLLTCKP
ncbi:MAG: hypothetical protein N2517_01895 [Ignavibacteria bacterium]|nr:hypothetical protein [Ignavibacteria bacterium]